MKATQDITNAANVRSATNEQDATAKMPSTVPRFVIVGADFSGLQTARALGNPPVIVTPCRRFPLERPRSQMGAVS